uniref:ATP synthase F0 subunit 8 n=1 Tax=Paralepetopsis sp. TaxID=3071116 RepID=A0AA96KGN1_9GAST|nr:ATP synthase F0 subunit 8 [Paralepetopsis sp.]
MYMDIPQLGPLNWLVLFFVFWLFVGLFSLVLWWEFDMSFSFSEGGVDSVGSGSVLGFGWSW